MKNAYYFAGGFTAGAVFGVCGWVLIYLSLTALLEALK